ncbi:MAG: hypothetical protein LBG64_01410 [Pseudomonadales bacterium]|jgi:drug/metabolite transporter (DMT)-like permease|nr:hypothetical protein [Pseudomonadales bacterium]
MGFLAAFLLPILHGTCNIIDGQFSTKRFKNPITLLFYLRVTYLLSLVLLLGIFGLPTFPGLEVFALLILAGSLDFLAGIPFLTAYKHADSSVVGAYLSLGKIFTPIVAFLIVGELLAPVQYFGFLIIIVASVALGTKNIRKFKINKGLFLMLLTAALSSVQVAVLARATRSMEVGEIVFYFTAMQFMLPFVLLFIRKQRRDIARSFTTYKSLLPIFLLLAVLAATGWFASTFAMSQLPVMVVSSINALRPFYMLTVGLVAHKIFNYSLNEKQSKREIVKKLICFLAIALGVAFSVGLFM